MENHELVKKVEHLDKKLKQMEQEHLDLPILTPLLTQLKKHYSLRLILSLGILTLALSAMVYATSLNKPFNFSDGQVASASQVNDNFDKLYDHVNSHFHPGFPDGFGGDVVNAYIDSSTPYNVGAGRTLYITSATSLATSNPQFITAGGVKYYSVAMMGGNLVQGLPLVFPSSTTIQTDTADGINFTGIEVTSGVSIVNQVITSSAYNVPAGSRLFILSMHRDGMSVTPNLVIDAAISVGCANMNDACIPNMSLPVIVDESIPITSDGDNINITGYLVPIY
ncbi:hypothetical protein KKI24_03925 [bacterium]|nr:hypothetical protein [bacterium]